jgi:hypothetical protein
MVQPGPTRDDGWSATERTDFEQKETKGTKRERGCDSLLLRMVPVWKCGALDPRNLNNAISRRNHARSLSPGGTTKYTKHTKERILNRRERSGNVDGIFFCCSAWFRCGSAEPEESSHPPPGDGRLNLSGIEKGRSTARTFHFFRLNPASRPPESAHRTLYPQSRSRSLFHREEPRKTRNTRKNGF